MENLWAGDKRKGLHTLEDVMHKCSRCGSEYDERDVSMFTDAWPPHYSVTTYIHFITAPSLAPTTCYWEEPLARYFQPWSSSTLLGADDNYFSFATQISKWSQTDKTCIPNWQFTSDCLLTILLVMLILLISHTSQGPQTDIHFTMVIITTQQLIAIIKLPYVLLTFVLPQQFCLPVN